jgi:hypothetical protein
MVEINIFKFNRLDGVGHSVVKYVIVRGIKLIRENSRDLLS